MKKLIWQIQSNYARMRAELTKVSCQNFNIHIEVDSISLYIGKAKLIEQKACCA
ncbi:MAG: Uncharacterised protein [Prochlorococcus marinus str. MIT 9215]|nr:MAG: Uncharacterised protein [Prochlorococcus marinus str. MIT 9215]